MNEKRAEARPPRSRRLAAIGEREAEQEAEKARAG
jgi:hypothetical protein